MASTETYTLVIYEADGTTPLVTITSIRGGTNPYLSTTPSGDGASFNPRTGESMSGAYTGAIADWPVGSMKRILTQYLSDSSNRSQLGFRRVDLTYQIAGGSPVTLIKGLLTSLRLTNAMTWEYTISDPMRAQGGLQIFGADVDSLMSAFLTAWPNRGCVFGGPVIGGFIGTAGGTQTIPDLGGWTMRVAKVYSVGTNLERYWLAPVNVYGPPMWDRNANIGDVADPINQAVQDLFINGEASYFGSTGFTTIQDALIKSSWTGLVFLIGSTPDIYRPKTPETGDAFDLHNPNALIRTTRGGEGVFCWKDGNTALTLGQIVKVRCLTIPASNVSPIYLDDHPITLLSDLWTAASLPFDASAVSDVTDALGADLRYALRITGPADLDTFSHEAILAPFGVGVRGNDAGELTPFLSRAVSDTLPSDTIGSDDVVQGTVLPFDLDASEGLHEITITARIIRRGGVQGSLQVVDNVVEQDVPSTFVNADPGAIPYGRMDLVIPGMIHSIGSQWSLSAFLKSIASDFFDRFGRGTLSAEMILLRGAAGENVLLGGDALIDLPQTANANYRLGDNPAITPRVMQIVRRTIRPEGYAVRWLDSGPNAQPLTTKPTLTIAASADLPRTVATVTITNAATLNGLGYGARIQWAVVPTGTPAAGDYVTVKDYDPGAIPTGAVVLPGVDAGSKVFVKGQSRLSATDRPSTFSTPVSVTLSSIDDPTSVTASPSGTDGSLATVSWVPGANATNDVSDVFIRLNGSAFSTAVKVGTVLAGSTRFKIAGLTPSTAYTASVQHRDTTTGDLSDAVDVNFTAGSTTRTLAAPVNPAVFAGSLDPFTGQPVLDGVYGLAVIAAEKPGFVELAEAVETAVGSGTYGSFSTIATVASVQSDWTILSSVAPQDGRKRRLKARHVGIGQTSSAYTTALDVLPWVPLALGPITTDLIIEVTALTPTYPSSTFKFQATAIDPAGSTPDIRIKSIARTTVLSGLAVGTYGASPQTWEINLTSAGQGAATLVLEAKVGTTTASYTLTLPEATTLGGLQGTVDITANGSWSFTVDAPSTAQSFRWMAQTGSFPADATVAAGGGGVTGVNAPGMFSVAGGGTLTFGQTIYITIVPFTGASYTGVYGPAIHIQGAYSTYSATKTVNYSTSSLLVRKIADSATAHVANLIIQQNAGELRCQFVNEPSLATWDQLFDAFLPMSQGNTLTAVDVDVNQNQASSGAGVYFGYTGTTGAYTSLGSGSASGMAGWETIPLTMSDSTTGRNYRLTIQLYGFGDSSVGWGNGTSGFRVTYTMPTPDKSY